MKKTIIFITVLLTALFLTKASFAQEAPVLLFSDLESGPKTGWEGSTTKGAAVTVWGRNFGSTRGNSYITINGAQVTEYAEWGTTGRQNGVVRNLQRTTFWLTSNAQDGTGTITVTVNGVTSNALPFTVRSGNIYFISVGQGNNAYDGKKATYLGGSSGPWRDILMAAPNNNAALRQGDTIYVKGGKYIITDIDGFMHLSPSSKGSENMPYAIVGYPAEIPIVDTASNPARGLVYGETYYWTFAKFKIINGGVGIGLYGDYGRVIGNWFDRENNNQWAGIVGLGLGANIKIYGNYFYSSGSDKYHHHIYGCAWGTCSDIHIGWNEFDLAVNRDHYGGIIDMRTSCYPSCALSNHLYIHDNYFHDGDDEAIYISDEGGKVTHVYIYNNIISNMTNSLSALMLLSQDVACYVYNNILYYPAGVSGYAATMGIGTTACQFKNNIFYLRPGQALLENNYGPHNYISDHDLYYNVSVPSGSWITVTNPVTSDPKFLTNGLDFHLQSSSPAIDTGTSLVSSIVTTDYDYNLRPMDGDKNGSAEYDIGAYEFSSTPSGASKTYYVATTGSDTNDGSIGSPFKTIRKAVEMTKGGGTIYLRGGDYVEQVEINSWKGEGGKDGNYLIISAYQGETVNIVGIDPTNHMGITVMAPYVRVQNLNFKSPAVLNFADYKDMGNVPADYGQAIGNSFTGNCVHYAGHLNVAASHLLVENNTFDLTATGSGIDGNCHDIYVLAGSGDYIADDITIRNNKLYRSSGFGIHVYDERKNTDDPPRYISNILIENNLVMNSATQSGIVVAAGSYNVHVNNVVIRNNIVVNPFRYGIGVSYNGAGIDNVKIYNNVIYNPNLDGSYSYGGIFVREGSTNVDIKNNLIFLLKTGVYHINNYGNSPSVFANNNLYWPTPVSLNRIVDSSSLAGDPLFVNPANKDFHLQSGSPAIDKGLTLTDVPKDKDGILRPQGSAYDIGAYESTGTYTPPPACTYTYSEWSACQSNGTQTRTIVSSSPSGCTDTPVLSQSCTYTSPPITTPGAPAIYYLDIESGPAGAFVTLNGKGFSLGDTIKFGDTTAAPLSSSNQYPIWPAQPPPIPSKVTVSVPNLSAGVYQVTVQNSNGASNQLSFTVRAGNIYYVSQFGSDTNSGSVSSPWKTLNYAVRHVTDGDFIYIKNGTWQEYDPSEPTRVIYWQTSYSQGKLGRPITLQAYPGEEVFLTAGGADEPREIISVITPYVNIIGFKLGENRRASIDVYAQGNGARIVNNEIFHAARDPAGSGGIDSSTANDGLQILGNYVHDVGTADSGSNKNHGMYIQGQNMLVAYNVVGDIVANDNFRSDVGIQTYPRDAVQNGVVVKNNLVFGVRRGILMDNAPGPGFLIYNNVIRNNDWSGIWIRSGSTAQIYNNVLVNNGWKGSSMDKNQILLSGNGATAIKNNIMYSSYDPGMIYGSSSADVDYNLYFYTAGSITNGGGVHSIEANPLFVNLDNYDFHLQAISPAKDVGTTISSINQDYEGISRPQGSGYDIGAYEYVSSTTTYPKGDVNQDTNVNSIDIQLAVNIILGLENNQQFVKNADLNNDGDANAIDLQLIVNIVLGV